MYYPPQNGQPPQQQVNYPQYPAQPYPPYAQRPIYAPPQPSPQELYRKGLRRTANGLGVLLVLFFALQIILALITEVPIYAAGLYDDLLKEDILYMLLNGVISMIIFFVAGIVYCLIRRLSFSALFPFERTGAGMLTKLCVIGIAFSLMSNYVVDLINGTFGLFGIQNNGGTFDTAAEPNVLMYFLTVAIMPALVEEFAFRGVIMGVMRPYSEGLALIVSSAAFALMHGNFVQMPFTFCCGLVFGYMDIKTNSLLPSIIIHFLNNGLSVLSDILLSYKILDEVGVNLMYGAIFAVTGILAFIFIKGLTQKNPGFFEMKDGNQVIPYRKKLTTVASSPTMITFAVIMLIYSVIVLVAL